MRYGIWLVAALLAACSVDHEEPTINLGKAADCSPAGVTCVVAAGKQAIALKLPSQVKPLTRFPVTVKVSGLSPERVVVDFAMVDMNMGKNRFALRQEGRLWTGEAILPVCTTGRTDWVATVQVSRDGGAVQATFPFHSER